MQLAFHVHHVHKTWSRTNRHTDLPRSVKMQGSDKACVTVQIIAVHADDPEFKGYDDISQLPKHRLAEIRRWARLFRVICC